MKYVKTVKAVRIEYEVLKQLRETMDVLKSIKDDLTEITKTDDEYGELLEEATSAWCGIYNFLFAYNEIYKLDK